MTAGKYIICSVCGKLFLQNNSEFICSECKEKSKAHEDPMESSELEPILIDGDEDNDFDDDPDYIIDDVDWFDDDAIDDFLADSKD